MQYNNEGPIQTTEIFKRKIPPSSSQILSADDGREHTVKDYLQRPINLQNFEWNITSPAFSILQSYEFPDVLLNQSLYREKFSGFLGIRADIHVRLQVNAQPFQAGRLLLVYIPYYKYLGAYGQHYTLGTQAVMPSVTGCPRLDLDISQQTEVDFVIPFVSPHSHFNLASGEGYYGRLQIMVYSPLSDTVGTGHVDCTLWVNFENIDLAFPTGAPLVTSSLNPVAQVGAEEVKAESYRSIAQDAGKLSSFLKSLPALPVLSEMVSPVTWALDGAEAFLKFCGYSKLQSTNIPSYLKQTPTHFMANYDGVDMSHNLGVASENSIELMPEMVGNDTDEMDIHHVIATPNYFANFSWTTAQAAGTTLTQFGVNPAEFYVAGGAPQSLISPTHLTYMSSLFTFWRGSIDITFKFIKTKFHSGRVRITFQPGWSTPNITRDSYNYSKVVDIRSETEIVFRVPYVATHPWLQVQASSNGAIITPADIACGVVRMEVLNELVAVSTVAASIDVIMEVSAGPDFELAVPTNSSLLPVLSSNDTIPTTVAPSQVARSLMDRIRAHAQVGTQEEEQDMPEKDQLGSKIEKPLWFNNTHLIGEKVRSIRQLIKRSFPVGTISGTSASINPYYFIYGPTAASSSPVSPTPMGYLDYFAHIYAFWRGSVNIKVIGQPSTLTTVYFRTSDIDAVYQNSVIGSTSLSGQFGVYQPVYTQLEGAVDLAVPFYCAYHMCPVTTLNDGIINSGLGLRPKGLIELRLTTDGATVYRHATDSFQFGYLIGTPICQFVQESRIP